MKSKNILLSFLGLAFAFMFFIAPSFSPVLAQTSGDPSQDGLNAVKQAYPSGAQGTTNDIPTVMKKIIDWALYLAAITAVIFIIIGGYYYITSAGNETQAGKGRSTLTNALIGLTLVVLSYLIVQIVYNFLTH